MRQLPLANLRTAAGSLTGREHLRAGKNNHDAFALRSEDEALAAVVTDGCGSGSHSELGARWGAECLVGSLLKHQKSGAALEEVAEKARQELLQEMRRLGVMLGVTRNDLSGSSKAKIVTNHLLFTVVGTLIRGDEVLLFSLGDGVIVRNDEVLVLGPFPQNRPPYLAYELLGLEGDYHFQTLPIFPRDHLDTLILGTDGVEDLLHLDPALATLAQDEKIFQNPDLVRRRLFQANRRAPQVGLPDDTTLIVIRSGRAS